MEQITIYNVTELKELHPDGFERAYKNWVDTVSSEPLFCQDEIMGSLKAVFKHADIDLKDWSISDSSPSWVKLSIPTFWSELAQDDLLVDDYTGQKALAWVKNAYDLKTVKRIEFTYVNDNGRKVKGFRYDITKKDGQSWDCGFTGVCYDHDFIDSLLDDIKSGCTLSDAYHNLADKAGALFYDEYKAQCEESYFVDHAEANDYQFLEDGTQI